MNMKFASSATLAAVMALTLGACGRESDRAARADAPLAGADSGGQAVRTNYEPQQRSAPRPAARRLEDGKPVWASNRQRSGEENAQKQFERNGADFSAASMDDYVSKAHAFVDAPPKGAQTITRPNGDVLYYDPKANVFLVADREGAPRTMFKPRDGMSYWLQQKQRQGERGSSRRASRDSSTGEGGASSGEDSNG